MNRKKEKTYLFILLLFLAGTFTSCVKQFIPNIGKYDELVVVDGNINDGPGPYTITLSKSSKVQELSKFSPFINCTVQIADDNGTTVTLTEKKPGVYKTDSLAIRGMPGRSYKLKITTAEGELYESDQEVLLEALKIQSVYGEVQRNGRYGYQFYVDAETAPTTDNYLLWKMESTYKFKADYKIACYYDNGVHPVFDEDTLRTCYKITTIPEFYLLNTNELQQKEIKRVALNLEGINSKALMIRYSLKVNQFTINKEAFTYWSTIKKLDQTGGDLYTQQPFQVKNNLRNITNPEKPVLGYFMMAGLSEKRIFITPVPFPFSMEKCPIPDPQRDPLGWFSNNPRVWPVFYTGTLFSPVYVDQPCIDCRKTGVLNKPPYWID